MTPRQDQALKFIKKFIKKNSHSPSYEEIGAACDQRSKAGTYRIVHGLAQSGLIVISPHRGRSIRVVERNCPHCGKALAA